MARGTVRKESKILELAKEVEIYNNRVWQEIFTFIGRQISHPYLREIIKYIPKVRKGKAANRPFATYLGYLLGGGKKGDRDIYKVSAAMEFLNCSITYIDDKILDDDPTVGDFISLHKKYDVHMAILASSQLRTLGRKLIIETIFSYSNKNTIKKILQEVEMINLKADYGQYLDVTYGEVYGASINDAIKINDLRTGQFVRRSAIIGALYADTDSKIVDIISKAFKYYGRAVQDANDLNDVILNLHSPGSKGQDIRLFKKTKPIIKALELADQKQKGILLSTLGNKYATELEIKKVSEVIKKTGAIDWAKKDIENTINKGINTLLKLPETDPREKAILYFLLLLWKVNKK